MSRSEKSIHETYQKAKSLDEILLPRLLGGSLIGIGFKYFPDKQTGPHEIEKDFWKYAEINWKIPSVKKGKEKYISVRFVEAENKADNKDALPELYRRIEPHHENPGRPHIGVIVGSAYYDLCQRGLIKYKYPLSAHIKMISEAAQLLNNGKKPSRAVIYKYIQEEFEWRRNEWLERNKKIHK